MARIRGAYGGGQIIGSVSGNTFQRGKTQTIIRNRTIPVNPNTPGQGNVKTAMQLASSAWLAVLTEAERIAWKLYAQATELTDVFGDKYKASARNMFIRTAVPSILGGGAIPTVAPSLPGIALQKLVAFTLSEADGVELSSVSPALAAGEALFISISPQQNITRNYYKSPYVSGVTITSADTLPVVLKTPAEGVVIGQRYFVRYRTADASGRMSNYDERFLGDVEV